MTRFSAKRPRGVDLEHSTTSTLSDVPPSGLDVIAQEGRARVPSGLALIATALLVVGPTVAMFMPLVPEAIGVSAIILMLVLIFLKVPVGFAMIVPSLIGLHEIGGWPVVEGALSRDAYEEVASWSLSVVPLFMLMGMLMWKSGASESLFDAGRLWLGRLPGGLGIGTNFAGAGLAAISGSTLGTTYALARVGIPEMLKAGYDKRLAIGAVICAGLPGQLIPPSIMLVIYAGLVEAPVGPQLMAGVGPGLLVLAVFSVAIFMFARLWPSSAPPQDEVITWRSRTIALIRTWPVPVLIVVIIGGIYSGVFTETEAAAVAVLITFGVTFLWKRGDHPLQAMGQASISTVAGVGAIFLMLIGIEMFSGMLSLSGISEGFTQWVEGLGLNRIEFLFLMMVFYLVFGTFMEPLPMMFLTVPILLPTIISLDISLLWFGVFIVFMGELAILTPPVGLLALVVHSITKEPDVNRGQSITLSDVYATVWRFMPFAVAVTVLLILFPEISTALPSWRQD